MRKRSNYRPRPVRNDVVGWVLSGMKPMNAVPATTTLRLRNHMALESLLKGTGTRADVDLIIGALNMTEVLALWGKGDDYRKEISDAQDALFAMAVRGAKTGRFLFTGPEMQAVKLGMEIHDAQLDVSLVSDIEKATDYVFHCIATKKAKVIREHI
jgi:hypothetical protein